MSSALSVFATAVAVLFGFWTVKSLYDRWFASRLGCKPIRVRVGIDPFFGLDLLYTSLQNRKANRVLPASQATFSGLGVDSYMRPSLDGATIMTKCPQIIKAVLSDERGEWGVQPVRGVTMGAFCGLGFLTADGKAWERSRMLLRPSFDRRNVSDFARFGTFIDKFLSELPADGTTFDIQERLMKLFVDTSQDFIIGQAPHSASKGTVSNNNDERQEFLAAFSKSLMGVGLRIVSGPFRILIPDSMTKDHWNKVYKYLDVRVAEAIKQRSLAKPESGVTHRSMLESVSALTQDQIEIRNQVLQGIIASLDTTPTLISNTLFLLARHEDVWQQLQKSLTLIDESAVSASKLRENELLRNVLSESLRLYPVFSHGGRTALCRAVLPTGGGADGQSPIMVRKGTGVSIDTYSLHREPSVFGKDPEEFRPDRWKEIRPTPWEYIPFGGGHRACLGQMKALNEASYTLWAIAHRYHRIEARDSGDFEGMQRLTTKNARGCKMALYK